MDTGEMLEHIVPEVLILKIRYYSFYTQSVTIQHNFIDEYNNNGLSKWNTCNDKHLVVPTTDLMVQLVMVILTTSGNRCKYLGDFGGLLSSEEGNVGDE